MSNFFWGILFQKKLLLLSELIDKYNGTLKHIHVQVKNMSSLFFSQQNNFLQGVDFS